MRRSLKTCWFYLFDLFHSYRCTSTAPRHDGPAVDNRAAIIGSNIQHHHTTCVHILYIRRVWWARRACCRQSRRRRPAAAPSPARPPPAVQTTHEQTTNRTDQTAGGSVPLGMCRRGHRCSPQCPTRDITYENAAYENMSCLIFHMGRHDIFICHIKKNTATVSSVRRTSSGAGSGSGSGSGAAASSQRCTEAARSTALSGHNSDEVTVMRRCLRRPR